MKLHNQYIQTFYFFLVFFSLTFSKELYAENFVEANEELENNLSEIPLSFYDMLAQSGEAFRVSGEKFKVKFEILFKGEIREVTLFPHEIRSDNYFGNTMSFAGANPETDKVAFFKADYEDGDFIRLTFSQTADGFNSVKGLIKDESEFYSFGSTALMSGVLVVEEMSKDKIADLMASCGVDGNEDKIHAAHITSDEDAVSHSKGVSDVAFNESRRILTKELRVLELATDADYEFNLKSLEQGKSANTRILEIINEVDAIYQSFLNIKVEVVFQNTWESIEDFTPYPIDSVTLSEDFESEFASSVQLTKKLISFKNLYPAYFGEDSYDAAIMFVGEIFKDDDLAASTNLVDSGIYSEGGVVGLAYSDTACKKFNDSKYSFAVVRSETSTTHYTDSYITTIAVHELAHILGASHLGDEDPEELNTVCNDFSTSNYFMCEFIETTIPFKEFAFSDFTIDRINNYLEETTCLETITAEVYEEEEFEVMEEEPELSVSVDEETIVTLDPEEPSLPCVDSDGDGWGWDGFKSCQVASDELPAFVVEEPTQETSEVDSLDPADLTKSEFPCIDTDGDGWGWNGSASCKVEDETSVQEIPEVVVPSVAQDVVSEEETESTTNITENLDLLCIDSDGDGWGWSVLGGSCKVTSNNSMISNLPLNAVCEDADGDGWGWNGVSSCRIE